MNAAALVLQALDQAGVQLAVDGSSVRLRPLPGQSVPIDLIDAARQHKSILLTRARIAAAARAQGLDDALVLAHLDAEDLAGYEGCHDVFLQVAALAVRDAAVAGSCSCDSCKSKRRNAPPSIAISADPCDENQTDQPITQQKNQHR